MTQHDISLNDDTLSALSRAASGLGYEIVDIAGFFDRLRAIASEQSTAVETLQSRSQTVIQASDSVCQASQELGASNDQSASIVDKTVSGLRESGESSRDVATWVHELSRKTGDVDETLKAVKSNNQEIVRIARQVNILAINAKIEAARAGEAGRGFSVVAVAINELSQKTGTAAVHISESVERLAQWVLTLADEAQEVAEKAANVLAAASENDQGLAEMQQSLAASQSQVDVIVKHAQNMRSAVSDFGPSLDSIGASVNETSSGIENAADRVNRLIDTSETILQHSAAAGGTSVDARYITFVQSAAAEVSKVFSEAVKSGHMRIDDLFDQNYQPIPGSNPEQVMTRFTDFTDSVLPAIQEPALDMDPRVVFCAAVDKNGYLPTHNNKFSQPPSADPVWNAGNCRNRRIFNDRVGLKAGQSTAPFLQQTYRRDMGGGQFVMMKDISAPIFVGDKHWGGLRFAVKYAL